VVCNEERRVALQAETLDEKILSKLDSRIAGIEGGLSGTEVVLAAARAKVADLMAAIEADAARTAREKRSKEIAAQVPVLSAAFAEYSAAVEKLAAALGAAPQFFEAQEVAQLAASTAEQLRAAAPRIIKITEDFARTALVEPPAPAEQPKQEQVKHPFKRDQYWENRHAPTAR
jgi:murein DD-endopeptidase MepM/ murein hydrolase activator NlpD